MTGQRNEHDRDREHRSTTVSVNAIDTFEKGMSLLREAFLSEREDRHAHVNQLRQELDQKEIKIKELMHRISELEIQSHNDRTRISELTGTIEKLGKFKKMVLTSIQEDGVDVDNVLGSRSRTGYDDIDSGRGGIGTAQSTPVRGVDYGLLSSSRYSETEVDTSALLQSISHITDLDSTHQIQRTPRDAESSLKYTTSSFTDEDVPLASKKVNRVVSFEQVNDQERQSRRQQTSNLRSNRDGSLPPTGSASSHNSSTSTRTKSSSAIDGREFFAKARSTLSYDEFTALLWNVKAYNAREQTRQRTLENLELLFGKTHQHLFEQFEKLISRP